MVPFFWQFQRNNFSEIEYRGEKIYPFFQFDRVGEYILKFSFISSNSEHLQAIIIHWGDFEGQIYINGEEVKKPKRRFPQTILDEEYAPKQFEVKVILRGGKLLICNGSDLLGDQKIWSSLYGGCAMIIEESSPNHYILHCNDHENDDDFDDLVFSLDIEKISDDEVTEQA